MQWKNGYHFVDALRKRGFKTIGSGCYSIVLAKPGQDRVIKVCINRTMDQWGLYINWANENGYAGNLAPMVYSYKVIYGEQHTFYVAVVERLANTLAAVTDTHRDNEYKFNKRLAALRTIIRCGYAGFVCGNEDVHPKDVLEFGMKLSKLCEYWDLHDGNWMVEADGPRLVLTDPMTDSNYGSSPVRMRSYSRWPRPVVYPEL